MTKHHKDLKMSLKRILERYCIIMLVGGLAFVINGCERDDITPPAETTTLVDSILHFHRRVLRAIRWRVRTRFSGYWITSQMLMLMFPTSCAVVTGSIQLDSRVSPIAETPSHRARSSSSVFVV